MRKRRSPRRLPVSEAEQMRRFIRRYQEEKGVEEYSMSDVVQYAVDRGYKIPTPISGFDQLTKKFSRAAAEEIRIDKETGKPYRANHARFTVQSDGKQLSLWFDMDRVRRPILEKYVYQRRQHVIQEVKQLTLDVTHWNRTHPTEEPVTVEADMADEVQWSINAPDDDEEKKTG